MNARHYVNTRQKSNNPRWALSSAPIGFEQPQRLPEKISSLWVVSRAETGDSQVMRRCHLQRNIPEGLGNAPGAATEVERFRRLTGCPEVHAHVNGHLPES